MGELGANPPRKAAVRPKMKILQIGLVDGMVGGGRINVL